MHEKKEKSDICKVRLGIPFRTDTEVRNVLSQAYASSQDAQNYFVLVLVLHVFVAVLCRVNSSQKPHLCCLYLG